jgi:copper chaperone CopZ
LRRTGTLKIAGMTCAGCAAAVRMAARSVEGVTAVKVSYAKGNAEVSFERSKTNPAAIAKVITDTSGFKAEPEFTSDSVTTVPAEDRNGAYIGGNNGTVLDREAFT